MNRLSRKRLFSYIRKGFRATISGHKKPSASFAQVVKRQTKHRTKKLCYTLLRKKVSCKSASTRGVIIRGSSLTYRPVSGRRALAKLKRGSRIAKGNYLLTFKLKPKAGGKTRVYRYRIKVVR